MNIDISARRLCGASR